MKHTSLILICLFVSQCVVDKKDKGLKELFNKHFGSEVKLPAPENIIIIPTSISPDSVWKLYNNDFKVVVLIDGSCPNCILELERWNRFITKNIDYKISFLIFVHTYNPDLSLKIIEDKMNLNTPIFLDTKNTFQNLNNWPISPLFNTVLLDKRNRVELIGNPLDDEQLWELYEQRITKKKKIPKDISDRMN